MTKRRYLNPFYPSFRHSLFGFANFHHVLNLFEAHRHERRGIVMTPRYREWLARRAAE